MASVFKRKRGDKGPWIAAWTDENGKARSKSTRTTCRRQLSGLPPSWRTTRPSDAPG